PPPAGCERPEPPRVVPLAPGWAGGAVPLVMFSSVEPSAPARPSARRLIAGREPPGFPAAPPEWSDGPWLPSGPGMLSQYWSIPAVPGGATQLCATAGPAEQARPTTTVDRARAS